jgi:uncharacterized protein
MYKILLTISILTIVSIVCLSPINSSNAQSSQNNHTIILSNRDFNSTLSASGTSMIKIKPDKVTLSLGVETTNKTADAALSSNSKLMNKTLTALKTAGVKENETSTSLFDISPNYNYSQSSRGDLTGFTARNSITIESFNINATSNWIDTAIAAGANNINSIDFTLSDKRLEQIKNSLIEPAINSAAQKANIAASALGLKIIGVKSIKLLEFTASPLPQQVFATKAMAATPPTPIIAGEQTISQNVDIVFVVGK